MSAVVKHLSIIGYETNPDRRRLVVNLCAAAYPDIQPWQVRRACLEPNNKTPIGFDPNKAVPAETLNEHFYTYLSQLLHPLEGHDVARHDLCLVKVTVAVLMSRKNFFSLTCLFVKLNRNGVNDPLVYSQVPTTTSASRTSSTWHRVLLVTTSCIVEILFCSWVLA